MVSVMHDDMLAGLYVPLVTPFAPDGRVAVDALTTLAHEVLDAGAAGIVALGTTGEPATLHNDERTAVIDACAAACRQRAATLIVGAGSSATAESVRALQELEAWPEVSAALVVVPSFIRPSEQGVLAHFARLADESPVPLVVYNIPYRTGQYVSAETVRQLGRPERIVGLKQAVGSIDADTVSLMAEPPGGVAILAGDDLFASPLLALGAPGAILASAHVCTTQFAELVSAWREGHTHRARALGHRLAALSKTLFAEPNPAVIKAVLHAQGRIPSPAVRLPLCPASPRATTIALRRVDSATAV
jgi:4-hydroxy-tetrahydrodipicolinate synthase